MKEYTESELQELKKIRNYFGEHDKTSFEHGAFDFLDKLINSATEEVVTKEDDLQSVDKELIEFASAISMDTLRKVIEDDEASRGNPQPAASVVPHSCTFNDSIQQRRKLLYECKELLSQHHYAARNDLEYPTDADFEELQIVVKKLQSMLNSDKNVAVSDTRDGHSSNDDGNKKISELREKFFKECTEELNGFADGNRLRKVNISVNEVFEWFKPYLKIPSIDWEGLEKEFYKWKEDYYKKYNWFPTPLEVMNFFKTNIYNHIK